MKNNPTIALVGNPNSGKTTLFNKLTGASQRVGNWPGVTVEKKQGKTTFDGQRYQIIDLPGTYNLASDFDLESIDETIAQEFIANGEPDVLVNIIDASSLERGLYLAHQLLTFDTPIVIALNMMDVAHKNGIQIDIGRLSEKLGCPVVPIVASQGEGINTLMKTVREQLGAPKPHREHDHLLDMPSPIDKQSADDLAHQKIALLFEQVDTVCREVLTKKRPDKKPLSERIDDLVLNRFLGFPIFMLAIYCLFFFAINIGGAFQEFFDTTAGLLFVDIPRAALTAIDAPDWLIALLCNGIGSGIQLVISFIPVIAALFFSLSLLEDIGYMTRAAFIVDRLMRAIGLPGKAFIPLIVGFGCNVPSVMAARTLNRESDRLVTSLMSPFMSCGARLTVYTLFVAAFFPSTGHNILFILYFTGIFVAILTAFLVRRFIFVAENSSSMMELSPYLIPTPRNLIIHTWHKLKGFVLRAGKSILLVVIILNVLNSIGTDGSFHVENRKNSVLSEIGRTITPIFTPIGLKEDNWPATVGIFTGIFAKEVVVGTLNELYSNTEEEAAAPDITSELASALHSIPVNLVAAVSDMTNPLGLPDDISSKEIMEEEGVTRKTFSALKHFFTPLSAFSYLLFILLYMPCVATVGAMVKEHGAFWAGFSVLWSYSIAYTFAVLVYQAGSFAAHPIYSFSWITGILLWQIALTAFVLWYGKKHAIKQRLIPAVQL